MHSRIFSKREREIIQSFLRGEIPITHRGFSQIRTRLKKFTELASDIELYIRLRDALTESEAAKPA